MMSFPPMPELSKARSDGSHLNIAASYEIDRSHGKRYSMNELIGAAEFEKFHTPADKIADARRLTAPKSTKNKTAKKNQLISMTK